MLSEREQILFRKALTYANGYRELGMFDDALHELASLGVEYSAMTEYQQMQLAIFMEAKRWEESLPVAGTLATNNASDAGAFVNLAYVTRRARGIGEAWAILEKASKKFPKEAIVHYNLGCYACCSKDLDTAKAHLLTAFSLDEKYLEMSSTDEDLKTLRDWLVKIPRSKESK
ncbi:hypothetical protein [Pelagicoccus sp. SDUM812002]|uniref:tetratricopeptide repeat protein n=1 Tax=Pelagicoccus sp. SDUM812002 TaxID=3041266 RepID=UPI00280D814A|nr:hypothetical protein [Pelagicoccus sp. SDUM812002]MDQ8187557.1 hypothetical protein [Pelagicoccus sp. SDUM812002]